MPEQKHKLQNSDEDNWLKLVEHKEGYKSEQLYRST